MPEPKEPKSQSTFRLSERTQSQLKVLAERWHCSQADVLSHGVEVLSDHDLSASVGDSYQSAEQGLRAWANLLDHATDSNASLFERAEWNYMADVNNGLSPLLLMSGAGLSLGGGPISHIIADVADGHRLDRTGDKWFPTGKAADKAINELIRKLQKLDFAHGMAVVVAIQFFWAHTEPGEIDHTEDDWWTLPFRRKLLRGDEPKMGRRKSGE